MSLNNLTHKQLTRVLAHLENTDVNQWKPEWFNLLLNLHKLLNTETAEDVYYNEVQQRSTTELTNSLSSSRQSADSTN